MRPSFLSSTRISHLALCEQVNARIAGCVCRIDDTSRGRKTFVKNKPGAIPRRLKNRRLHCASRWGYVWAFEKALYLLPSLFAGAPLPAAMMGRVMLKVWAAGLRGHEPPPTPKPLTSTPFLPHELRPNPFFTAFPPEANS